MIVPIESVEGINWKFLIRDDYITIAPEVFMCITLKKSVEKYIRRIEK